MTFPLQHACEDVEKMILGNKCDLEDKRVINKDKGEAVRKWKLKEKGNFDSFSLLDCKGTWYSVSRDFG